MSSQYTSILDEAKAAVDARRPVYGSPKPNFQRIAALWSAYFGKDVSLADVANLMILVKVARLQETPSHRDSWVDVAGYADCGFEVSQP